MFKQQNLKISKTNGNNPTKKLGEQTKKSNFNVINPNIHPTNTTSTGIPIIGLNPLKGKGGLNNKRFGSFEEKTLKLTLDYGGNIAKLNDENMKNPSRGKNIPSTINNNKKKNFTSNYSLGQQNFQKNEIRTPTNKNMISSPIDKNINSNNSQFSLTNFASFYTIKDLNLRNKPSNNNHNKVPKTFLGENKSLYERGLKTNSKNDNVVVDNVNVNNDLTKNNYEKKTKQKSYSVLINPIAINNENPTSSIIKKPEIPEDSTDDFGNDTPKRVMNRFNTIHTEKNDADFIKQITKENVLIPKVHGRNSSVSNNTIKSATSLIQNVIPYMKKPDKIALIMCTNPVVPLSLRAKFVVGCTNVSKYYKLQYIYQELIAQLNESQNQVKKKLNIYCSNFEVMRQVELGFIPSKTVQVFINLITFADENEFKHDINNYTAQILSKMLLVLVMERVKINYREEFARKQITNNYVQMLFKWLQKNKISSLKELLFYKLSGNVIIFPDMHYVMEEMMEENPQIFDLNHEVLKNNSKVCKILIYFILDLKKYVEQKCSDGTFIYTLRLIKQEEKSLKFKIFKLKNEYGYLNY